VAQNTSNMTYKRDDLLKDRLINLDENEPYRTLIFKILAHDFGSDYGSLINFQGKTYNLTLKIEEINPNYEK